MKDELIAAAELGEETRKFLESRIGKALIDKALQGIADIQEALEVVDPDNKKEIQRLQTEAWRCRSFGAWLQEFVSNGDNAIAIFRQQESQ